MNKKALSERDVCTKFIHPAIAGAGWDLHSQVREEFYITDGRIVVRGRMTKRMKGKFADYVLYYKPNIPVAIVEAKDNNHRVGDGMQQALEYAAMLDIPFAFASNGDAFLAHDRTGQSVQTEREIPTLLPALCDARAHDQSKFAGAFSAQRSEDAHDLAGHFGRCGGREGHPRRPRGWLS